MDLPARRPATAARRKRSVKELTKYIKDEQEPGFVPDARHDGRAGSVD